MSHCRQLVCTQCSSKQSLQSEAPTYSYFAWKKGLSPCTSWIKGRPHFSQFCSRHWTGSAFSYSMGSPQLGQKRHWLSFWQGDGRGRPQDCAPIPLRNVGSFLCNFRNHTPIPPPFSGFNSVFSFLGGSSPNKQQTSRNPRSILAQCLRAAG